MGEVRKCKDWIRTYLKYTAASEAPDRFHFWSGAAAIAGALRKKVSLDMGLFEWTPNLYVFLVAPPGIVSKSTTAGIAMELLAEVPGVIFGPTSVTWQALIEKFEESLIKWDPEPDAERRILAGKGIEMSCLTIAASELGTFFNPDDREMIDVLVDLYDGRKGGVSRRTMAHGEHIAKSPWLNLISCTTPAWISEHLSSHFTGGGFSSRCIFVWADSKRRLVAYPMLEMDSGLAPIRQALVHDLRQIASLHGRFRLTPDAIGLGKALYAKSFEGVSASTRPDVLMGALARKQTHLHKLAMILSASESDSLVIEEHHLRAADAMISQIEPDLSVIFRWNKKEDVALISQQLLDCINKAGRVRKDTLFRHFYKAISYTTFDAAIDGLVNGNLIKLTNIDTVLHLEMNNDIPKDELVQNITDYLKAKGS